MYLSHWGMRRRPFDNSHALEFFVPVESASLALAKLRYVLSSELGAAALTGPAGVGKTQVARIVCNELAAAGWITAYLTNPSGTCAETLSRIAFLLGTLVPEEAALPALMATLTELREAGKKVCLAVDEVHTIHDPDILENLRMLLDQERAERRLLNLVLIGQPAMKKKLAAASDFASHLALNIKMEPMGPEETNNYVLYRLKVAGCNSGIFTRRAADMIYRLAGGLPRNVNRLCELSLVTGFGLGAKKVAPEIVRMAAEDLGLATAPGPVGRTTTRIIRRPEALPAASAQLPEPPAAGEEIDILASLGTD